MVLFCRDMRCVALLSAWFAYSIPLNIIAILKALSQGMHKSIVSIG